MLGYSQKIRKFSPLHMDDGEEFIMEFRGEIVMESPSDRSLVRSKAILNFCSRSIIIELEDPNAPDSLFKYHYRFFSEPPSLYK